MIVLMQLIQMKHSYTHKNNQVYFNIMLKSYFKVKCLQVKFYKEPDSSYFI